MKDPMTQRCVTPRPSLWRRGLRRCQGWVLAGLWALAGTVAATPDDGDTAVWFERQRYPSAEALYQSQAWRDSGLRCSADLAMARVAPRAQPRRQLRVEDCTLALTRIDPDYNPLVGEAFVIPVVFHVIYRSDGTGLLNPATIDSQIDALNADFASQVTTSIQFDLVDVTYTENDAWFAAEDDTLFKPTLRRDPSRFLNIYSQAPEAGSLGYAYLPQSMAGDDLDGVVVLHNTVGRNNGFFPYDQGRTLVHEVGHYLGLFHTFEPEGVCANTYESGDLIVDTPPQTAPDYGTVGSSTCGVPSAINNYMNYSDDAAMVTFTAEQTNRMICSLLSYRPAVFSLSGIEEELPSSGLPPWLLYELQRRSTGSP